jgi:hypothetical protein
MTRPGDRPHRQDVVERRQLVSPLWQQSNAEILGVAVGRREHPEEELRLQERGEIVLARIR